MLLFAVRCAWRGFLQMSVVCFCFFFFQAEDGIRDLGETGVQTCALPILLIHSNCAFPANIVEALVKRKDELEQVEIYHALTVGELPYLRPGMEGHFIHNATFIGRNSREA